MRSKDQYTSATITTSITFDPSTSNVITSYGQNGHTCMATTYFAALVAGLLVLLLVAMVICITLCLQRRNYASKDLGGPPSYTNHGMFQDAKL